MIITLSSDTGTHLFWLEEHPYFVVNIELYMLIFMNTACIDVRTFVFIFIINKLV